jgi:excisionase family DNA binding protein
MEGLLSALTDISTYNKIIFFFTDQLLEPPDDPEVLLPFVNKQEVAHKALAAGAEPNELSKLSMLPVQEQIEAARKYPESLRKTILRVATSTAISLLYETVFSFTGGNQVVLIFGRNAQLRFNLFRMIDASVKTREPGQIGISSKNLPITSSIKKWPHRFRRFNTDQVTCSQLAQDDVVGLPFPWTSSIRVPELVKECANILRGEYPISYPVEDVSKNPRALLVEGHYDGFLLAIPRPSNMKNFSITLRTGNGIKKEAPAKESDGAAPTVKRDWMTRAEVAEAIGKSKDTVDNYIRDGKLESNKAGREVRITKESVEKYLQDT